MKQIATLQKTKFFGPDLGKDVAADEITGNYKEDVYSGESSMNQRHASVIEHDAQNRNSSNSTDIRTVESVTRVWHENLSEKTHRGKRCIWQLNYLGVSLIHLVGQN
jgi:hypothetical protein